MKDFDPPRILAFWKQMMLRHRDERRWGRPMSDPMRWHEHETIGLAVAQTVGAGYVSVYVRGLEKANHAKVAERLDRWAAELTERLDAPFRAKGDRHFFFRQRLEIDLCDETTWDDAGDFILMATLRTEAALADIFKAEP